MRKKEAGRVTLYQQYKAERTGAQINNDEYNYSLIYYISIVCEVILKYILTHAVVT